MEPTTQFSRQNRIVNLLLLNSSFINSPGLMHGKMGIAVCFFYLDRESDLSVYEDYTGELIDEIYGETHKKFPGDFKDGLADIRCGIECFVQKKHINADANQVSEEFDNKIGHEITFQTNSNFEGSKEIHFQSKNVLLVDNIPTSAKIFWHFS